MNHESLDHDFIDFNFQRTIPHKFSQYGPSLTVGDVNGDGLDDLFVAASRNFKQKWFIQQKEGTFLQQEVAYKISEKLEEEDAGTLLFDADNDGDLDLYIARGCAQYPENHEYYQDILLLNDGRGNFVQNQTALPKLTANGSAVKAADYDRDGDLDLFIGSRVLPFTYPLADRSYILRNESTTSEVKFIDATKEVAKELEKPGLISDALWTDFNGDFWPDLIIAGEWMPLRFFKNVKGQLIEVTQETGISGQLGWWNSLAAADLDNDGDMDYIAGNVGENINYKASEDEPVRVYAKDLDNNGTIDPLISYYLRDSIGVKKEYLYHPWQDVTKQYVGIRKKFNSFGDFGAATLSEMFSDGLLEDATVHTLNYMNTTWIENMGDGTFKFHALPVAAQLAPVYGLLPYDFNNDGFLDIFMVGNDYGMEVQQGPADAMVGILLENTGNKQFRIVPLEDSHFLVPGDGKSLVRLNNASGKNLIIASQNNDSLRVFEPQQESRTKRILPNEIKAVVDFGENQQRIMEFYWGSSFQSQSSRTITLPSKFVKIELFDNNGKATRAIE